MATRTLDSGKTLKSATARFRAARDRGVAWLLDHIASDGRPVGADTQNGWGRVPWALAVSGESAAGHAVLAWAEREALDGSGHFRAGPYGGGDRFGSYPLSHFAIGAWLLERYDVALKCMGAIRALQDSSTGGVPVDPPGGQWAHRHDLLSTAQAGVAALFSGQEDIIDGVHRWIVDLVGQQPDFPGRFHTARDGAELLVEPEPDFVWLSITDFTQPRQSYYTTGMAAVFLAGYAMRRGDTAALALGHRLLSANIGGTSAQFDDLESVQACKFAWGAAAMQTADPEADYRDHLLRMGDWFIARQSPDGAWTPSRFATPQPGDVHKLIKTAEHVMEINAVIAALGHLAGRG
ncbi:MAG: hypothetical protein M0R03_05135 [Novosphingobium sp.]|nr:hypothetical protein [Novosphingobium sp.]